MQTRISLQLPRHCFSSIPISQVVTPCIQAGDAAAVPRLHSMLLLATDVLCVFNKPSGISVQGGTSTSAHMDAWAVAAHSASAPWAMPLCPRLVHRLDKGEYSHFFHAAIVPYSLLRARIFQMCRVYPTNVLRHQRRARNGQRQVSDRALLSPLSRGLLHQPSLFAEMRLANGRKRSLEVSSRRCILLLSPPPLQTLTE
jgi:hypothetical protein